MRDEQLHLIQRIQAGDSAAEHEFFRQYKDAIFWKVCRQIQTDRENIKDIAGEIYLAMLEGLRKKSFLPEKWESLEAYVWGITNNKIRNWLKEEKRDGKLFHPEPPSEEIAAASEEYLLENAELAQLLRSCLATLDAKYKEALELRYFQELSVQEISTQLGIPAPRISERIHYAKKQLRQAWQKKAKAGSIFAWIFLLL